MQAKKSEEAIGGVGSAHDFNGSIKTLSDGVEVAAVNLNRFTADDVAKWLDIHHPALKGSARRTSIAVRLGRMFKDGQVDILQKGLRGKPQIFRIKETPK